MKDLNSLWPLCATAKTIATAGSFSMTHMALILLVAFGFFSIYYPVHWSPCKASRPKV